MRLGWDVSILFEKMNGKVSSWFDVQVTSGLRVIIHIF